MNDRARRFETRVLRPLWLLTITLGLVAATQRAWGSVVIAALLVWYISIAGSALHPLQGDLDLAKGPTTGDAALAEAVLLSDALQVGMVSRAATHVAIITAVEVGWILIGWLTWRWYLALPVAYFTATIIGGALKYHFSVVVVRASVPSVPSEP
jgi:hypothetical protein